MKVAVIGVGYVGLPTALLLARAGHDVLAVDVDPRVVAALASGRVHLEPGALQPLLDEPGVRARLRAAGAVEPADAFLITVPTPVDASGRAADLSMVDAATRSIVPHLRPGNLVVLESTVPPGTTDGLVRTLLATSGLDVPGQVHVAHAPERVFPGDMIREILDNQRLIGGVDEASTALAVALYRSFVRGRIHVTDARTAEFTKLLENTYRDVNIALANEIALLARRFDVDPFAAIALANHHPRVAILQPGIGVGGHCIPVDPWFLVTGNEALARLVPTARAVNDAVPERIAAVIRAARPSVRRVVLAGAAYKPEIGDLRESPAVAVAEALRHAGVEVIHLDPLAPGYAYGDLVAHCQGADVLAVLVPHARILGDLESSRARLPASLVVLQPADLVRG